MAKSRRIDVGGLLSFSEEQMQLLIAVWRSLATGRAVGQLRLESIISDLGADQETAETFLRGQSERDEQGRIAGLLGLSLKDHPHGFLVNGVKMSTWCAMDTLFLPAMLGQTARVTSRSPVSDVEVSLTVTPEGVQDLQPTEAVVSLKIIDPDAADLTCAEGIQSSLCQHVLFFASRQEALQWTGDRKDIDIVSVADGFELALQMWGKGRAWPVVAKP